MDFIIQKVNGLDVSGLNHSDAVKAFQEAKEPITVEIIRRSSSKSSESDNSHVDGVSPSQMESKETSVASPSNDLKCVTQGTQTEVSLIGAEWIDIPEWDLAVDVSPVTDCSDSPDADYVFPGDLPTSLTQYLEKEIDIEEVILERSTDEESLGLTIFYASTQLRQNGTPSVEEPKETSTEVLVSQIEPGSIAAKDGRIRIGDQILQINGNELTSKVQTENLFHECGKKMTFVVSRTQCYDEDDLEEGDDIEALLYGGGEEEGDSENQVIDASSEFFNSTNTHFIHSSERNDSIICPTECDLQKHNEKTTIQSNSSASCSSNSSNNRDKKYYPKVSDRTKASDNDAVVPSIVGRPPIPVPESEHIYESIPDVSIINEPLYCVPYDTESLPRSVPVIATQRSPKRSVGGGSGTNSSEERRRALRQRDCKSTKENKSHRSKDLNCVGSPAVCLESSNLQSGLKEERDSSSAYNTGDSAGSNPRAEGLEMSLGQDPSLRKSTLTLASPHPLECVRQHKETEVGVFAVPDCCSCRSMITQREKVTKPLANPLSPGRRKSRTGARHFRPCLNNHTMYTTKENLSQTIWLQQQLFQQSQKPSCGNGCDELLYEQDKRHGQNQESENSQMEWKVKIRSDGTRYITRRPTRRKIMRDREKTLTEERAGITTDDDARSEMKMGKYWPRGERKRQLDRERERKKKTEQLKKQYEPRHFHNHHNVTASVPHNYPTLENGLHQALWKDPGLRRKNGGGLTMDSHFQKNSMNLRKFSGVSDIRPVMIPPQSLLVRPSFQHVQQIPHRPSFVPPVVRSHNFCSPLSPTAQQIPQESVLSVTTV